MKKSKQTASAGDHSTILQAGSNINIFHSENVPIEIVDREIKGIVEKLKKSRFYHEFDRVKSSLVIARRLVDGDISVGSDKIREKGLAWCARILAPSAELNKADELLKLASTLGDSPETKIAEAFILSRKGDKRSALKTLAGIDSDDSRTAGLMIVAHHDGAKDALTWMKESGYTYEDIDSDGKYFLINYQLQLGYWDEASHTIDTFSKSDFEATPILHHMAALTKLTVAIPEELRAVVLNQVPFDAQGFPLASDSVAIGARQTAHKHFLDASKTANELDCPSSARIDDEYALWLELRDPALFVHGKNRLETKLQDPETSLAFVHYALQFGVKLNLDKVERDIDRNISINGGMTMDAAIARFALAFTKDSPEEVATYIARHHNQLATHIDPKLMQIRQIEMFSRAGFIEKANEVLDQLVTRGISPELEKNLRCIIEEAEGINPIESRKTLYKTTGTLGNLINLVTQLEEHKHWDDLCEYSKQLFEKTRSLKDAERLVRALNNTHRSSALIEFLKSNSDLLSQSRDLQMAYAWALYHEGALLESRTALEGLRDDAGNPNYRGLQVNLGIALGDWLSLSDYIEDEYQNRGNISPHDLMRIGQLALHLGSPRARDIVFEAAAKANDDATILTAAYFVSTSAGWEDDPQVTHWLERAVELSGEDGPLQKMSLKDILDQKPEMERQESESWRLLAQGQIPMFLAAQSLNRSLIDLTTFPALANPSQSDPRRRSAIPAYSGTRLPVGFDISGKTVALDATALLTLSLLKILDLALDAFDTVYIPHSTLSWLFEERQKAAFHQPSRIANAHKVQNLVAADVLEKFAPSTVASSNLSTQVGEELASLIAEAERVREGDDTQHIVVRSAPVHRLASLMEEEADLSAHAAVLSSCLAVVSKLRQKGQITAKEEKHAQAYLKMHERPWPNQPEIADGATLYLDDLAITYLLHLGLLGKLNAAGLKAVASPRIVSEVGALISYEHVSDQVKDVIERIRSMMSSRIESGHVKVGTIRNFNNAVEKTIPEHPTASIIALAPNCDAAIVDDRFVNQHKNIHEGNALTPILSTLDLLDALVRAGVISDEERLENRTHLRQAGYFFVSVNEAELEMCLKASNIVDGEVVETAELKAIRESVLRVRMTDWLQLPNEAPWLDGTLKAFIHVLRNLWKGVADIDQVTARSNWLVDQIDIRGWVHRLVPENADNVVRIGRGTSILMLLTPPPIVDESIVDAYRNWVQERILAPIMEEEPDLYAWLIERYKEFITTVAETDLSEEDEP